MSRSCADNVLILQDLLFVKANAFPSEYAQLATGIHSDIEIFVSHAQQLLQ